MDIAELSPYLRDRIKTGPGCWEWTGPVNPQGYGVANLPGGVRAGAHRLVYRLLVGPITEETLDHMCHDPEECPPGPGCPHRRCVNPSHLEPAPRVANALRGGSPGGLNMRKPRCPKCGGEYSTTANGWRRCAPCIARWRREQAEAETGRHREAGGWTTECVRGHPWRDETTRWSNGKRYCKLCDTENNRAYRARKRARARASV